MKNDSTAAESNLVLTSEYNEEETQFIQKMADKRGKTLEEYQKDSALNSTKKRFKDKRINENLVKMSALVVQTDSHLKNNKSKSLENDVKELKGIIGETLCFL